MKKLKKEQLEEIQKINNQFMGLKIQIADAEINKAKAVKELQQVQADFSKIEAALMEEYGRDATIDIKSGTVTPPPKKEENNGENK